MRRLSALILALVPQSGFAQDAGSGAVIAGRWCANCHTIERAPGGARADSVPSFVDIANRPNTSRESLRAAMTGQHGRMPDFSLTNAEMNDLSSYVLGLRK